MWIKTYLVGGLEDFFMTFQYFPYIGNVIIPTDFHVFQRGGEKPPTSYNYQVRVYFGVWANQLDHLFAATPGDRSNRFLPEQFLERATKSPRQPWWDLEKPRVFPAGRAAQRMGLTCGDGDLASNTLGLMMKIVTNKIWTLLGTKRDTPIMSVVLDCFSFTHLTVV